MGAEQDLILSIINSSLATAEVFTDQADEAADRALELSQGRSMSSGYTSTDPSITAIEPVVPTVNDSLLTYNAQLNTLIGLLSAELEAYFVKYYPLQSDAYDEATLWLIDTITNGGTGIPVDIEAQIWNRERDRHLRDGARLEADIVSGYSARGFDITQPDMMYSLNQIKFEQHGKIGVASTTIAGKQADIKVDMIKFAIAQAIDSRFKAMNAASDYIKSLMQAPNAAVELASLNTDAQAKMMSATADMYRARLTRDQLIIGAQTDIMQSSVIHEKTWCDTIQGEIDGNVKAAQVAADTYARVASAAISAVNGIVGTSSSSFA